MCAEAYDIIELLSVIYTNNTVSKYVNVHPESISSFSGEEKGQYPDNIESYCIKQYNWDMPTTMENIESAKKDELIIESASKEKISYKLSEKGRALLSKNEAGAHNIESCASEHCNWDRPKLWRTTTQQRRTKW